MLSEMFQFFCPNPGQAFDLIKDHDSDGQSRQWLLLGRKVCLKAWKRLRGVGPSFTYSSFWKGNLHQIKVTLFHCYHFLVNKSLDQT